MLISKFAFAVDLKSPLLSERRRSQKQSDLAMLKAWLPSLVTPLSVSSIPSLFSGMKQKKTDFTFIQFMLSPNHPAYFLFPSPTTSYGYRYAPTTAQMVQGRLSGLIGRSSGYVESLPTAIQYRLTALKGVQRDHSALEAEFQKDIFELEKKYAEKYRPLYERRRQLVEGKDEPKSDEIEKGVQAEEEDEDDESDFEDEEDEDEEESEKKPKGVKPTSEELEQAPKGIPEFWLTTLKNHLGLSELITERDEEALKHLVDIRVTYPEGGKSGFTLVFEFAEGAKEFFENTKLEKSYFYQDEVGYEGDFVYDHAEGTKIQWKEGKDLTVKIETKKQRNKSEFPRFICLHL
jgi:nucleosome assembly protein 1-like 1